MVLTIVLILLFLFVVKSSSSKDRPLDTGHYTRFRRGRLRENNEERRLRDNKRNKI